MDGEDSTRQITKSYAAQLYDYSRTPYLSLINSAAILVSPIISPPVDIAITSNGKSRLLFKNLSSQTRRIGLTGKNALLFGTAQALGSWMIYDDDVESGSGFIMAWSTLYMIVNGKGSLRAITRYGRTWPFVLSCMATGNALLYGRRFISGQF
ncbi:hypothetical protein KAFR_0J01310 [Kazachstania africana CBS 2517]|uniref:Altered inheritance of mitochondria protein 19, mitochondrial n=1 Tax=Kazachstania africana (strain ATCC 22294 / BCRC 22015 / CBS 2517 / CECT 1963 / NBRC 1671 / NRRL Y-8276) TaxID=1071382 RepID=H2B0P8_KAZAF|nr:hypothetical protein KAFR_0J01310 [Kazachstania africana CBS 2517]CCF60198.1 hypothetical protein KAFR_0J01310 [Kazachstania africana CBS 2517]